MPLALCAVLLAGLALQLTMPDPPSPVVFPRAPRQSMPVAPPADPILPAYAAIDARPLFSPNRLAPATADEAAAGSFSLLGLASGGAGSTAVLRAADGSVHVVRLGETLLGWRLGAIVGDAAVLVRGRESHRLQVGAAPATSPPAASR